MSDTADGSKHTNPTGPGYLGVYTAHHYTAYVSVGTVAHVDWTTETEVFAVDDEVEPGIQLVEAHQRHTLDECNVQEQGMGTIVHLSQDVLRNLLGFEKSGDIRVYERDPYGLTIVQAADDPFVDDDPHDRGVSA